MDLLPQYSDAQDVLDRAAGAPTQDAMADIVEGYISESEDGHTRLIALTYCGAITYGRILRQTFYPDAASLAYMASMHWRSGVLTEHQAAAWSLAGAAWCGDPDNMHAILEAHDAIFGSVGVMDVLIELLDLLRGATVPSWPLYPPPSRPRDGV